MKNLFTRFLVSTLTALAITMTAVAPIDLGRVGQMLVPTLSAQTFTHNTTTLSANVAATDTTISVTSASAATGSSFGSIAAGQLLLVDQEIMTITAVSSTTLTVQRRARPTAHTSGTTVYIGTANSFYQVDPPAGRCTTANFPTFWINLQTGGLFTCGTNSVWAKSIAPWQTPFLSGSGATLTLTAAQSGQTILFDRAAGIVYTLPVPVPGMTFDFVVLTTITSNNATVVTDGASTFIQGSVLGFVSGAASNAAANLTGWVCNGTTHIKVQMNGTTTGGIKGTRLRFVAISSTVWNVDGLAIQSGTIATPCST